jgi:hypothetical protein
MVDSLPIATPVTILGNICVNVVNPYTNNTWREALLIKTMRRQQIFLRSMNVPKKE